MSAQAVCNNNAFISIGNGTVLTANILLNQNPGTVSNNGILTVSTLNNAGAVQGNGIFNVVQNIYNSGSFSPGTSSFNYVGNGAQKICSMDYYNLSINSNGVRNITLSDSGTIGVKNNFVPDLSTTNYSIQGSLIKFAGVIAQNAPAFSYYNLEVENLTGVTLTGSATVENSIKVSSGNFDSNGNLTLLSDATNTAEIDGNGNGDVLGSVTVQRYLPSGFGYKHISSPFQAATVNELSQEVDLNSTFTSVYRYNENLISSGWLNYTSPTGVLNPMEGYSANFGGSSSAKTIEISGVVNNGVIASALFNHNYAYTKGFNLVGNPYPSTIDWNIPGGWNRTNIDNALYFFNASSTDQFAGTYSSYINGVSSDGIASNLVASMQGFFIHVTEGAYPVSASLEINNNARINNTQASYHRQVQVKNKALVRLEAKYSDLMIAGDPTVIYFDEQSTTSFEEDLDALKIKNTDLFSPSLYSISSNGDLLSINAVPQLTDSLFEVKLGLNTDQSGLFSFNTLSIENIPSGWYTYFADLETGKYQDLVSIPTYRVQLEKGNYVDRFKLIFSLNAIADQSEVSVFSVYMQQNSLFVILNQDRSDEGEIMISDIQGRVVLQQKIVGMGKHEFKNKFNSGIYIVNYSWEKGTESKKIFISNGQ